MVARKRETTITVDTITPETVANAVVELLTTKRNFQYFTSDPEAELRVYLLSDTQINVQLTK